MPRYRCVIKHVSPERDEEATELGVFTASNAGAATIQANEELVRVINPGLKDQDLQTLSGTILTELVPDPVEMDADDEQDTDNLDAQSALEGDEVDEAALDRMVGGAGDHPEEVAAA